MPRISSKRQVTLPVESLEAAGLRPGDEVVIEAEGADRIVVHRAAPDLRSALGGLRRALRAQSPGEAALDRRVRRALEEVGPQLSSALED